MMAPNKRYKIYNGLTARAWSTLEHLEAHVTNNKYRVRGTPDPTREQVRAWLRLRQEKLMERGYEPPFPTEVLLLGLRGAGKSVRAEILHWLGEKTSEEKLPDVEGMRQEISDSLIDLSDEQVRAMWRVMEKNR